MVYITDLMQIIYSFSVASGVRNLVRANPYYLLSLLECSFNLYNHQSSSNECWPQIKQFDKVMSPAMIIGVRSSHLDQVSLIVLLYER